MNPSFGKDKRLAKLRPSRQKKWRLTGLDGHAISTFPWSPRRGASIHPSIPGTTAPPLTEEVMEFFFGAQSLMTCSATTLARVRLADDRGQSTHRDAAKTHFHGFL